MRDQHLIAPLAQRNAPIDILLRRDGLRDPPLSIPADSIAEGELHEQSMDGIIVVQALDLAHDLVLSDAILGSSQDDEGALDAGLCGSLELHLDIGGRVGAGALLDDGQVGLETGELGLGGLDAGSNVGADGT